MRRLVESLVTLVALGVAGCATSASQSASPAASQSVSPGASSSASPSAAQSEARAEILRIDAEWRRAVDEGSDVDRIVSFWSDDATVMPPGSPSLVGKAAIREFVTESLNTPGFKITWKTDELVVSSSGDMAYGIGTNHVTLTGEDGEEIEIDGKTATVWRRVPGQGWKCALDIWNDASPFDE
jgi:ketosteroid isomerase-like protein